jgi:hypothetical protein
MGWIRCVRCEKSQCHFVAQTFVLIAPVQYVLQLFSCSYETIPNAPKYYETGRNINLGSNAMDWVRLLQKKSRHDFVDRPFALIAPVHPVLHRVSCSYETIPNAPKHYETHKKMSLWSNGVDQVRWLRKLTTQLRGMNFCINCTNSVCFATSFMQLRNDPKCTQILQNIPKLYFRVQWGG